jgi:hypothetical protein
MQQICGRTQTRVSAKLEALNRKWGKSMRATKSAALIFSFCFGLPIFVVCPQAHSQTIVSLALKNGETIELGPLYWVLRCKSLLKSTPEAEILEGPPGVSVAVKEAMVLPRLQECGNRVAGGMLTVTAKDIEDPSYSKLTVRVKYRTRDGDRQ